MIELIASESELIEIECPTIEPEVEPEVEPSEVESGDLKADYVRLINFKQSKD